MCFAPKGSSPSIPPRGGPRGNTPPSREGGAYSRPQSQSKPYDPQSRCPICKGEFPQSVLQYHVNKCYANKAQGGGASGGGGGGNAAAPLMADHSMPPLDPMTNNGQNMMQQQMTDQNGNPLPWKDRERVVDREYEREVASRGSFYDGFGRPGCGAPARNRNGEIVTNVRGNFDNMDQQTCFSPVQQGYGGSRSVSTPVQRPAPYLSPLIPPGSPNSRMASMYTTTNSEYGSYSRGSTPASSSRTSFSSRFASPMASPNPYLREPQSASLPSRMVETYPPINPNNRQLPPNNSYNDDDLDTANSNMGGVGGSGGSGSGSNELPGGMHINPDGTTTITPKERSAILSVIDENKTLRQENEELQTMIMGLKQVIKRYRERFGPID